MSNVATIETDETIGHEGVKETLESLVVALILAFVFRAFVVEAFVIPTGSMAPTLYGAHGTLLCEDCGIEFAYGVKDLEDKRQVVKVLSGSDATCPNCNHSNTNLRVNDSARNAEKGDRILVLKWPFDFGGWLLGPKRWDVTVFKDPADGVTNFIKRLVGLPGEVLLIMDGDVYTVALDDLSPEAVAELEQLRHEKYEFRTQEKRGKLRTVSAEVLAELDGKMRIARKTPTAQKALWLRVYDHDFPPQTLDHQQPRWAPVRGDSSGWNTTGRRVHFEDRGVNGDRLAFVGKQIRATCAYNIHARGLPPLVSDLRVGFVLTPNSDEGTLRLRLEKLGRVFWASARMDGQVTLNESQEVPTERTDTMASADLPPFGVGESVEISFELVDYRLSLRVGDREVLSSSDDPTSAAFYGPDLKTLRRRRSGRPQNPQIAAEGGSMDLTHLVIERDEYYYVHNMSAGGYGLSWAPEAGWANPTSPILLRDGEYFMLGDNTAASKDSRLWDQTGPHLVGRGEAFQLGTVPRDQLIGRAFFVYWPSGQGLEWLPIPLLKRVRIIPDAGRMRWIR